MRFESLKAFCDLVETESFTKAAQINSVIQSAVSQTITALEKQFQSLLVERSKKNFRLTSEGGLVYDYGKRLLQSYQTILSKIQELNNEISGQIASPPIIVSAPELIHAAQTSSCLLRQTWPNGTCAHRCRRSGWRRRGRGFFKGDFCDLTRNLDCDVRGPLVDLQNLDLPVSLSLA